MLVELFMSDDHAKIIAKLQHYYNFLNNRKEEFNLSYVQNHDAFAFRQIRDCEETIEEFVKTFEQNIYEEKR